MALLFTVVLSARPSGISQSHNPLFIPTEAQSVCKWTWVMADRERLTGPPIQGRHAASNKHRRTHTLALTHKRSHAHIHNRETKQIRKVFIFVLRFYLLLFCSPCVFMSCHLVKRLYGLHRPHGYECGEVDGGSFRTPSGPALSASDKRASPEGFTLQTGKLFNLTSSPILYLFIFLQAFSESIGLQNKR